MANRYFTQFFYSFFKKPVLLAGKIPLSASAAVGAVSIKGIASVVKSGTGLYTITLEDEYFDLGSISAMPVDSAQNLSITFKQINLPAKTLVMETKIAGVVGDIASACSIYINLVLSNSSV